jgi:hypothetical protein
MSKALRKQVASQERKHEQDKRDGYWTTIKNHIKGNPTSLKKIAAMVEGHAFSNAGLIAQQFPKTGAKSNENVPGKIPARALMRMHPGRFTEAQLQTCDDNGDKGLQKLCCLGQVGEMKERRYNHQDRDPDLYYDNAQQAYVNHGNAILNRVNIDANGHIDFQMCGAFSRAGPNGRTITCHINGETRNLLSDPGQDAEFENNWSYTNATLNRTNRDGGKMSTPLHALVNSPQRV